LFKPADSLGPIIATITLTMFGFVTGSTTQDATALLGIKVLLFVMPTLMHAISLIFIYLFPYHGEALEKLQSELVKLHAVKKENYESSKSEKFRSEI